MSIKVVERMIDYCNQLLASFKVGNSDKVLKWLEYLEKENLAEVSLAREFHIKFLLTLHAGIEKQIKLIRKNIDDSTTGMKRVLVILKALEEVVDQRPFRDQLISEVIHPIMKSWGFKKIRRTFVKQEGNYFKKLTIYTSSTSDYYDVHFIFEVNVIGPNVKIEYHRLNNDWFKLNQDTPLDDVKAQIQAQLLKQVKPFFDKYR